jgi:hypothetical protein
MGHKESGGVGGLLRDKLKKYSLLASLKSLLGNNEL